MFVSTATRQITKQANDTHDLAVAAGKQADNALAQSVATKQMAATAEAAFSASSRPYVGIENILVGPPRNEDFEFSVVIKNSGTVTVEGLKVDERIIQDGILEIPKEPVGHDLPATLIPQGQIQYRGHISGPIVNRILAGAVMYAVIVKISYRWRNKSETYCPKEQYLPEFRKFGEVGSDCSPWNEK